METNAENSWKARLAGRIAPAMAEEIDIFEREIELTKAGKVDAKIFAETRLRRGAYGQRYDNGSRHDGAETRAIAYPSGSALKGPETLWDAPGMQRIKIPFGGLSAAQMEVLADIAEEYSDCILHITTRQDIQLHFVHIEDTPDMMRRLASVGITTREACGNTVRNVTACPLAGICRDEPFDVTPYANALAGFLLGHKDAQDFGRKFKIAFSGCQEHACGLASMHDIGAVARVRRGANGEEERGFAFFIGGGLGAVPYQAKLFDEFLPEADLLPVSQALCRIFARLGERKNRARARFKFVVDKVGVEELRKMVVEERKIMPHEEAWTNWIDGARAFKEIPTAAAGSSGAKSPDFEKWRSTNVYPQRQKGFSAVSITCPLGDLTSRQTRKLADMARKYTPESVRLTVEQNIVFRWVRDESLPEFHAELAAAGLGEPGAESIVDVTACPGTDTCKLGISSSRGLAAELRTRLAAKGYHYNEAVRRMRIKVSGCFNSCGQHHVADLGFYGNSRKVGGYTVPHFQVVLGGQWAENANAYGLAIGAVPSKSIPSVVERYLDRYMKEKTEKESFRDYFLRIGKKEAKAMIEDLCRVPDHAEDRSYYVDWADAREFTIGDLGTGECAGEVVSVTEFDLTAAERIVFDAQVLLETQGNAEAAAEHAFRAMTTAARGLVRMRNIDVKNEASDILSEFRTRFYDAGTFKPNFAQYFFMLAEKGFKGISEEHAHQRVEEAQLFIEAAHDCYNKAVAIGAKPAVGVPTSK